MKKLIFIFCFIVISSNVLMAQEDESQSENDIQLSMNADLVSRYVWRGLLYSSNVNIQPSIGLSCNNFFMGAWGSYGLSDKYAEVDFYAGYGLGNLTLTVNDYYTENETDMDQYDHFNFNNETTNHALEGSLAYYFGDNCPLTLTGAMFLYGNDRDAEGENFYSTYIEAHYDWQTAGEYQWSAFVGGTPAEGLYADNAAIVNVGFSLTNELIINDKLTLPVEGSLISNPEAEDVFLVMKVTF